MDTSIPGRIEPRPTLADLAIETILPDDTPILATVFPDKEVPATQFASLRRPVGSRLLVTADDTIGRSTRMIEESMETSRYEGSIGWHGRQRTIPWLDIDRAMEEADAARNSGMDVDPLFDLEAAHTADMIRKNQLHNEMLAGLELLDESNYPESHRYSVIGETAPGAGDGVLDVVNNPGVREILLDAGDAIKDDGVNLPPTVTVIGVGARRGLQKNPAFLELLPDTAIKRLREEDLMTILEMPNGSKIVFPNIRVQYQGGAQPVPLIDNFIGLYRVVPAADRVNATYGRNYWKKDRRNSKRVYVNSMIQGLAEDRAMSLQNWYKVGVVQPELGYHIRTVSNPVDES